MRYQPKMGLDTVSMKMKLIFEREWRFPGTVLLQKNIICRNFFEKNYRDSKKGQIGCHSIFLKMGGTSH